jgi:hypothetical protein
MDAYQYVGNCAGEDGAAELELVTRVVPGGGRGAAEWSSSVEQQRGAAAWSWSWSWTTVTQVVLGGGNGAEACATASFLV